MKRNRATAHNATRRQLLIGATLASGLVALPGLAGATTNAPSGKPFKIVVPFPPGGTVDTVTRLLSTPFSDAIGQTVIVDNRGGAGGTIGARYVSQAAPDGQTILLTASNQVINPLILRSVPYDPVKDFTPICYIGYVPQLVLVKSDFPANTFEEFVSMARSKPGELTWATSGLGTAGHFAEELIKMQGNLQMNIVPYRGGGPALMDLIAGHVTAMVEPVPSAMPHVQSGRLKVLAVTSPQRAASLPNVPTVAESGMPGFELPSWYGIWGPAGLSEETTNKIYQGIKKALQSEDLTSKLNALSFVSVAAPPADFEKFIRTETDKYAKIVKTAGIVID